MQAEIMNRIKVRMNTDEYNEAVMEELAQTIFDRLCLRLSIADNNLPALFQSVVVDATIKLWRRRYYEGIESESIASVSTHFIDDVLSEYDKEIKMFISSGQSSSVSGVVHFI